MFACINHFIVIVPHTAKIQFQLENSSIVKGFAYQRGPGRNTFVYFTNPKGSRVNKKIAILAHGVFTFDSITTVQHEIEKDMNIQKFLEHFDHQGVMLIVTDNFIYGIRDPLGTRVLYYTSNGYFTAVSSDYNVLLKLCRELSLSLSFDILAIFEFLVLHVIKTERTLVKEIKQLRAGELLIISLKDLKYSITRYWNPLKTLSNMPKKDVEDASGIAYNILNVLKSIYILIEVLCKQITSPIGVHVSGGLDTTLIFMLLYRNCQERIMPVHVSIGNARETHLVELLSKEFSAPVKIEHYPLSFIMSRYMELHKIFLRSITYPREGDASLPYIFVAEAISKHNCKLAVSADGGDEFFGGYSMYRAFGSYLLRKLRFNEYIAFIKFLSKSSKINKVQLFKETISYLLYRLKPIKALRIKRRLNKIMSKNMKKNKKLRDNIYQYILHYANLNCTGDKSPASFFKQELVEYAYHRLPQLASSDSKAHELYGISLVFPIASKAVFECLIKLPDYLFFYPYGVRSIERMLLKLLGAPKEIWLGRKHAFSISELILSNVDLMDTIAKKLRCNGLLTHYLNVEALHGLNLHNAYNIQVLVEHIWG